MTLSLLPVANRLIIQWSCRSITQNGPLLKCQISSTRPLVLLLQETRGPYKIPYYNTFMEPKIAHASKDPAKPKTGLGQAAALVHLSCQAVQHKWDAASNSNREVVVVRIQPPGGKPMLVISLYYRPQCNSKTTATYDWITYLFSLNFSGSIIIGRDFNAKSSLWGYSQSDLRGKVLRQALKLSSLQLRNEPFVQTRVGLHSSHRDTTPDVTITTPGIIKKCKLKTPLGVATISPSSVISTVKNFVRNTRIPQQIGISLDPAFKSVTNRTSLSSYMQSPILVLQPRNQLSALLRLRTQTSTCMRCS